MVRITLDLLRKRAEHNEGEISTLEEIALHQENIEKIETLNNTCRDLKILLMQNNLIGKIENLNMLKRLEYLNLALNNIEVIENLEGLESLKKLDLTVNFIGDARNVECLRRNENLEILYLTGNPCTDWDGYREFVVATLPGLKELDSTEIERSERILAVQNYARAKDGITGGYLDYLERKSRPRITEVASDGDEDEEERLSKFWSSKGYHTPEERIAIAEMSEKRGRRTEPITEETKRPPRLTSPGGTPYNLNRAKVPFHLDDEDPENLLLEIRLRRYTDPSHVEAEVAPKHVRVTIKGKILQLRLPCEVSVTGSVAERNATTGVLTLRMPRLEALPVIRQPSRLSKPEIKEPMEPRFQQRRRQLLEIGPARDELDFSRICDRKRTRDSSEDFIDDPRVPPLE